MTRRLLTVSSCALALALATPASAHPLAQPAPTGPTLFVEPTLPDIEQAISDAAHEFDVPEPLLQVIAHSESRWRHRPARISAEGRVGLFQLSPERQSLAADLLELPLAEVSANIDDHARAFAVLLDYQRPQASSAEIGAWRDALSFAMQLAPTASEAIIDSWLATLEAGIIDRLDDGSPIAIAPAAIEAGYLGLFAASRASSCRSIDYPGAAEVLTTCNYSPASRNPGDVDAVIIHTVEGSASGAVSWFHDCTYNGLGSQVSAHYVVSESGSVTQVVAEEDIGWHVSCWNSFTIGIEHEGYASDSFHPDALYQASAALTTDILGDWNLPVDRAYVMGHVEIDSNCNQNGHWDPGPGWDWDYYMSLMGSTNTVNLTELVGYVRHTDLYEAAYGIAGTQVSISGFGTVATDSSGHYVFDEIPPGTWNVCANASGYSSNCRTKTVEADLTNWASILLQPGTGDDDTAGDDDDDTAGDDDDTAGDDDTAAAGDDDTAAAGDDDTAVADDDDSDGGGFDDDDDGNDRRRSRQNGCSCAASGVSASGSAWLGLVLVVVMGRARRRS